MHFLGLYSSPAESETLCLMPVEPSDEFEAQTGTVVVSVLCQTNLGFDWPLKMRSVLGALPSGPKIEGAENSPAQV